MLRPAAFAAAGLLCSTALLAGCGDARPSTARTGSGVSCTVCHGDPGRQPTAANPTLPAAPPLGTHGETATTDRAVGAHQLHLNDGALSLAVACGECHPVPTSFGHSNGVVDMSWGPLATARGATGIAWNGSTCASTYCHGNFKNGNAANAPTWTAPRASPCGTCHGLPPGGTHPVVAATACGDCHPGYTGIAVNLALHVNGVVDGGEPSGPGTSCGGCHAATLARMTATTPPAGSTRHFLGGGDNPIDPGGTWTGPLKSSTPYATASCVSTCHVDHVHDNPATGTSHSYNVSQDATSGASRAVTRNASGAITGGTPDATDYQGGPGYGTNANGGMCLSCHRNAVDATHPAVDKVAYDWSAHDYTNFSTYGPWQYTLHEGSIFNRNCTKCHADPGDAQNDSTTPFGAVHSSPYPSLLSGTTNPAGAPATFVCYGCHGNGTTGTNRSGKDLATQIAKAASHPVNADAVHDTVSEAAASYADGKLTGPNRHVSCLDCHDPHAAAEFTHLVGSNAVAGGAPYAAGSATFTNASTAVTGTGTAWTGYAGWKIRNDADGKWYQVASVTSATSLTLTAAYTGATASAAAYTIAPSSPLASATGAAFSAPATNWSTPAAANFTFTQSAAYEYQVCLKCHSSFGFGSNPVASPSGATYAAGTATFTSGSTAVTGAGTAWTASQVDMVIKNNADGIWYTVTAVAGATSLTVNRPYAGASAAGAAYTLQERETDAALELATSNQSYHPVMGALPAVDPGANGSSTLADSQLTAPWQHGAGNPSRTMYCTDCHGNDAGGAAVQGPHGSAAKWLLAGPNLNWPTTAQGGTVLYDLGNNPTGNAFLAGLFCLNCHPMRDNGASNTTAAWSGNVVHYNHSGPQVSNVACVQCHILVPHGGKMGRLIATNSPGLPQRYAWQGNPANVLVTQFRKAAAPGGYGTGNCNTNCGGHGTVTGTAADLPLSW